MFKLSALLLPALLFVFAITNCSQDEIPPNNNSSSSSSTITKKITNGMVLYSDTWTGSDPTPSFTWNKWDGSCEIEKYIEYPAEGYSANKIFNNNTHTWWGFAIEASPVESGDLSNLTNGCLVFSLKTSYASWFKVGIQSGVYPSDTVAAIYFLNGVRGFTNDNQWHTISIPMKDLIATAPSIDLKKITSFFFIQSIATESTPVYIDNIYFTKTNTNTSPGEPTIVIPAPSNSSDTWTPGSGWNLVWSEEFNSTTLNTSSWNYETNFGGGNSEIQQYSTNKNNIQIKEWDSNRYLVITAYHTGSEITSARINTLGKHSWMYGKMAARIQLPYGQGMFPAFWMMGTNHDTAGWPACGEIDIMEFKGGIGYDNKTIGNLFWDGGGFTQAGGPFNNAIPSGIMADDFHVFSVEWNASEIIWFCDGVEFARKSITATDMTEFHQNFYIILNFGIGSTWTGYPDSTTVFPQHMYIDWIRVYQKP